MFDFDEVVDRRNTGSYKWDVAPGELPMWVADMDFKTAPAIIEAMHKRADHGVFGYGVIPDEWYEAYISWWERRHGFRMEKDWLIFSTGVVPTLSSVVRKCTSVGENVLILTPVYNIFYNSILNNGRHVLESRLRYENGVYSIDWEDLENKMADPQTSMMILCNPHNPTGNIWNRDELQQLGDMALKNHVIVVSDEIHCDIMDPGYSYLSFGSVSKECLMNSIICMAPTKCFNIAGLQTSAICVADPHLRHLVNRGLNTDECAEPNAFAVPVTVAAFSEGEQWLNELNAYLSENKRIVREYMAENHPEIKVVMSHATYLLWFDCSEITDDTTKLCSYIREKTGLYLSAGEQFGGNGKCFIRYNTAAPRSVLMEGLRRFTRGLL